jgi:hypothetical protein
MEGRIVVFDNEELVSPLLESVDRAASEKV